MTRDEAETALYTALGEPIGLLCSTNNPKSVKAQLGTYRRQLGDPALDVLEFRVVGLADGNLAIVKKAEKETL